MSNDKAKMPNKAQSLNVKRLVLALRYLGFNCYLEFGNVVRGFSLVPHAPEGSHFRILRHPNSFGILRITLLDALI